MKNGNFDVVFEVHEELINRGLAAAFYSGFLYKKGKWKPSTPKLPASIKDLAEVKYELRLKGEPVVDVIADKKIRILFTAEAYLTLFDGYELEFDVNFGAEGTADYDKATDAIILDLTNLHLSDFKVDNTHNLPAKPFKAVNDILSEVVTENLAHKWELFDMKNPLFAAKLPKMPDGAANRVPVTFGGMKTFDNKVIACCFNVLDYHGGDINAVANFIGGNNYAVGITEEAIHRVFNFWWDRTTLPKTVAKDKVYHIGALTTFLDFIADVVDIGARIASAGFLETDFAVEDVWLEYGASITLLKPAFDLKDGNKIQITDCQAKARLYVRAKARVSVSVEVDTSSIIPDDWTPWEDDVTLTKKTTTFELFSLTMNDVTVKAAGEGAVVLNADNELEGQINTLSVHVDLGDEWYTHLPEYVINDVIFGLLKEMIIEKLDKFMIFPAVVVKKLPKTDFTVAVDLNLLDVDDQELFVGAAIDIKELKTPTVPVPKYVANRNPIRKEVHRCDCISVQRMDESNKVGYYTLYEAFKDGYDGCKKCIPEYHTR